MDSATLHQATCYSSLGLDKQLSYNWAIHTSKRPRMGNPPEIPEDWTSPERWVWEQIAAGSQADLNNQTSGQALLDPLATEGWGEDRRLSAGFLQTILTQREFVEATPHGGARITGALVDDAPLNLEHARLQRPLWLDKSRILTEIKFRNLRVDGEFSLQGSFVAEYLNLRGADIGKDAYLLYATFESGLEAGSAQIGGSLVMSGSTFRKDVNLNSARVAGAAFMRSGAAFESGLNLVAARVDGNLEMSSSTFDEEVNLNSVRVTGAALLNDGAAFNGRLDLGSARIDGSLVMSGSTFEKEVNVNSATVAGAGFIRSGAVFKSGLNLGSVRIGGNLEIYGSTFEEEVNLNSATLTGAALLHSGAAFNGRLDMGFARIDGNLEMNGSTFEKDVNLNSVMISGAAILRGGATFKGSINLAYARIDGNLEMNASSFEQEVDLNSTTVGGDFSLGYSENTPANWGSLASLSLRNTEVGTLQDWWLDKERNAWPRKYQLEGFTYSRLGSIEAGRDADMLNRPTSSYIEWLEGNLGGSPQPYEGLADRFHESGQPHKATDVLYAARERQRSRAWLTVDEYGHPKPREWQQALGLMALNVTIGYGLGNRYFRALWWVLGLTLLGTIVLFYSGGNGDGGWWRIFFASFDQLLPVVTLDTAHSALIYGDASAKPPVPAKSYGVQVYFYAHKILGWILASFLIAGLSGLTQRN